VTGESRRNLERAEALRRYRAAAEQSLVPAMSRLGEIYLIGLVAPDTATPAALQRLEQGSEDSLLKRLYPQGLSVTQDLEQALFREQMARQS